MDKPCFIDDDDHFKFDHKKMHKWYEAAVEKISGLEVEDIEIPYLIFLMGAEASLICQSIEKLH